MNDPRLASSHKGDARYYKRAFNFGVVWNLQHQPRRQIVNRFLERMKPKATDLVIDLGSTNLPEPLENIFECYYPFKDRIVAVGTEDCSLLETQYKGLRFIRVKSGEKLPFNDSTFDIGFSNGTIEHVGSREKQRAFLEEFLRVSRRVFIATPNRWYPVELHTRLPFVHWFPPRIFRAVIRNLGFDFYAEEENLNLLSARDFNSLLPQKRGYKVTFLRNYFLGFASNLIMIIEK